VGVIGGVTTLVELFDDVFVVEGVVVLLVVVLGVVVLVVEFDVSVLWSSLEEMPVETVQVVPSLKTTLIFY
jgi:hypothetical protein